MKAKTHVLAGAVTGYLIYPTWIGVLAGAAGSILSDIDEPKSYIGRLFLPLSVLLKWTIKHRTVTHSFLFVISVFFGVAVLSFLYKFNWMISLAAAGGVLSHILGDMIMGKVVLFWPLPKKAGIEVPLWLYLIIDRISRVGLIVLILYYVFFGHALNNLLTYNLNWIKAL